MHTLFLIALVLVVLAMHAWMEVSAGSSLHVYDPEIGLDAQSGPRNKLPRGEFVGKTAPFVLASTGLTLLLYSLQAGLIILALAAVLTFFGVLRTPLRGEHFR